VAAAAVAIQFALLAWFGAELILGAGQVGLAERVMGAAEATWPLAVVLFCRLPGKYHYREEAEPIPVHSTKAA
jgi:hypothetical protein